MNKKVICSMMIVICLGLSGCKALNTLGKIAGRSSDNGTSEASASSSSGEYDSLTYHWTHERVFEKQAADEARDMLLTAADNGDKEAFKGCFAEEIRSKRGFDQAVDEFFASYPAGMLTAERSDRSGGAGGSYNDGSIVKNGGTYSTLTLNGEWYYFSIAYCFVDTDHPEKVGVTDFEVYNLEGRAVYIDKFSRDPEFGEDNYLVCDILSKDDVSARLINGTPYLWKDTDTPKLTEDEMRQLLTRYRDLGAKEVSGVIGEPNAEIKFSNHTGYDCYYELAPVNGQPRYARICSRTSRGSIIDAYVCSAEDDTMDFDNPLCPWIKPT